MSEVISEVRLDPDAPDPGDGCQKDPPPNPPNYVAFDRPQARPSQGVFVVEVRCSTQKQNAAGRVLNFEAYIGLTKFGEARVRYTDQFGADPEPGFEMLVCDWQLGKDAEPLADCPDVPGGP